MTKPGIFLILCAGTVLAAGASSASAVLAKGGAKVPAISGDYAIVGWSTSGGDSSGEALLTDSSGSWKIIINGGGSLATTSYLESEGVDSTDAQALVNAIVQTFEMTSEHFRNAPEAIYLVKSASRPQQGVQILETVGSTCRVRQKGHLYQLRLLDDGLRPVSGGEPLLSGPSEHGGFWRMRRLTTSELRKYDTCTWHAKATAV